ncbi:hypothetical protein [uncultured Mediterranean phage uvMED]|nr:hypothetical protein [uncultured Mediterranean phage uvMED]
MNKLKFLHERTAKSQQKEFVSKGRMQEYGRERYQKRLKQREEDEKSNLVTKDTWELQFGWKHNRPDWNKDLKRYYNKYEHFKGIHAKADKR